MTDASARKKGSWLSHPLTTMLVGFLLTGVLGTALTQNFMDRREREKLRAEAVAARKEAVSQLSELMTARHLQAELLLEAVESGAPPEEIERLKAEHGEAYRAWRTQRAGAMLLARELMNDESYEEFSDFVNVRLVENTFVPIRGCIADVYAASKDRQAALDAIERCDLKRLIARSVDCGNAIVEALYAFAAVGTSSSAAAESELDREARRRVEEACP